jgi:hypothetical protein
MTANNLAIKDFWNIPNAVGLTPTQRPPADATVSYNVRWSGVTNRITLLDEKERFTADLIENAATIDWSARQEGFSFTSDPAATSHSAYAAIGRERNGVFFTTPAAAPAPAVAPAAPAPAAQPARPPAQVPAALPRTGQALSLPGGALSLGAAALLAGVLLRRRRL